MTYPHPIAILYTGTTLPTRAHPNARLIHAPMLAIRPLDFDLEAVRARLEEPSTLLFYSQHSARIVWESGLFDGQDLSRHAFWAVGSKTAHWLEKHLPVSVSTPPSERFQTLSQTLEKTNFPGDIIVFSLADNLRDLGPVARARGVAFVDIPVYETMRRQQAPLEEILETEDPRWITFSSPRAVDALLDDLAPSLLVDRSMAAIGPSTAQALVDRGFEPTIVLDVPDKDGLIDAILTFEQAFPGLPPTR